MEKLGKSNFLEYSFYRKILSNLGYSMRSVIVLPAFETKSIEKIPKNREHLLQLYQTGDVKPLKIHSHKVVNISAWFSNESKEEFYRLSAKLMRSKLYEPYFIAPTSIPLYVTS